MPKEPALLPWEGPGNGLSVSMTFKLFLMGEQEFAREERHSSRGSSF